MLEEGEEELEMSLTELGTDAHELAEGDDGSCTESVVVELLLRVLADLDDHWGEGTEEILGDDLLLDDV